MLDRIRQAFNNLPEDDFETFYQKYVLESEARSVRNDVKHIENIGLSIEDINKVFESLNTITEELKDSEFIIGRFKN